MGFRYYALVHHTDLRTPDADAVDLKHYPAAIIDRLVVQQRYRRDPVVRACFLPALPSCGRTCPRSSGSIAGMSPRWSWVRAKD
jgi:hypothetical protein